MREQIKAAHAVGAKRVVSYDRECELVERGHDDKIDGGTFRVIVPGKDLGTEYKNSKIGLCKNRVKTVAGGILGLLNHIQRYGKKVDVVYLDEVYLMDPRAFAVICMLSEKQYCIGDDQQNEAGDENQSFGMPLLTDTLISDDIPRVNIALNTPCDVVSYLNKKWERQETKTLSTIVDSVRVITGKRPPPICVPDCDKHENTVDCVRGACFDKKHAYTMKYPTVKKVQGVRFEEYNIFLSSTGKGLLQVPGQEIVGLTRHTRALNLYFATAGQKSLIDVPRFDHGCFIVGGRQELKVGRVNRIAKEVKYISSDVEYDANR